MFPNTKLAQSGPTTSTNARTGPATVAVKQLKSGPGALTSIAIMDTATEFILLIDTAATSAANGAVNLACPPISVTLNVEKVINFNAPIQFTSGLLAATSSTAFSAGVPTLTAGGSTMWVVAQVQ